MKKIIIASTSTIHGSLYLEYIMKDLQYFFKDIEELLFIPYARPSGITHKDYTEIVRNAFSKINLKVKGIQDYPNPVTAIEQAQGVFIGGGNTFVLTDMLYKNNLILPLQKVVKNGTPYLGTSAGSNICGLSIKTTNDMPIVYPPSFKTLGFVPFNINPHYLEPDPKSEHMGETRETRIAEFHHYNSQPVVGLREGSYLKVDGENIILKGDLKARIFERNKAPYEITPETNLKDLK